MKKCLTILTCSMLLFSMSCLAADMPVELGVLVNTIKGIAEQANKQEEAEGSNLPQPPQPAKQVDQAQQNSQLEQANEDAANAKQEADRAKEEAVMAKQEAMIAKQEAEQAKQEAAMMKQEAEKSKANDLTSQSDVVATTPTTEPALDEPVQQETLPEIDPTPVAETLVPVVDESPAATVVNAQQDPNPVQVGGLETRLQQNFGLDWKDRLAKLSLVAALVAFGTLLLLGMTNTIVVWYDWSDFYNTIAIFITGLVGLLLASMIKDPFISPVIAIITLLIVLGLLIQCVRLSIIHNRNILIGLIVGVFKLALSLFSILFVLGMLGDLSDDKKSSGAKLFALWALGIFSWIIYQMINGERVYNKRGLQLNLEK
jgi:hypothetical protein